MTTALPLRHSRKHVDTHNAPMHTKVNPEPLALTLSQRMELKGETLNIHTYNQVGNI